MTAWLRSFQPKHLCCKRWNVRACPGTWDTPHIRSTSESSAAPGRLRSHVSSGLQQRLLLAESDAKALTHQIVQLGGDPHVRTAADHAGAHMVAESAAAAAAGITQ